MAVIRPFQGLRYALDGADLQSVVAPPYDVLSDEQRNLLAQHPTNVVHLTLPEHQTDDRNKFVRYSRSAAKLAEWRRQNVLALEKSAVFYRYTQRFTAPGYPGELERMSLIALIKTEPYESGVVLPHEETFPKHKEDRLRILEATRSHLECIFGLYEDADGALHDRIARAKSDGALQLEAEGVFHRLDLIDDPVTVEALVNEFADKKVWIADGHHRYETACTFRQSIGAREGLIAEDFMMMALTSMFDPGLVLLPTHRILADLPMEPAAMLEALSESFTLDLVAPADLPKAMAAGQASGRQVFGLALPGELAYLLTAKSPLPVPGGGSQALKALDVTVLHRLILEQHLQIAGQDRIAYTRDAQEAIAYVRGGRGAAFLMNPPSVEDMKVIASGGEKMPQKSTYYYPKILSGLVLWSLGDFET